MAPSRRVVLAGFAALACPSLVTAARARIGRNRIAVASYPFRARMDFPGNPDRDPALPAWDLEAFAGFVRRELDISAIEPLNWHFSSTEPARLATLRTALDRLGMRVCNIPVDAPANPCGDARAQAEAIATYRKWIDVAVALRAPAIRVHPPVCGRPDDIAAVVRAFRPTLAYAARRGVLVQLENETFAAASAARVEAIVTRAASPRLRILPDFGNSLATGPAAANSATVARLFAHAGAVCHVKAMDMVDGRAVQVDVPAILAAARRAGFTGTYSIETSAAEPIGDTRRLIDLILATA